MSRTPSGLRIPPGMQDLLPEEAALLEQLEGRLLSLFRQWAYHRVMTPTLEYAACVQPDVDREDQLYKFFDRQGRILVLRPEFTTPIARLVSTRLRGEELPLRLCYSGDVFRYSGARLREFRQAGVELIGSAEELGDAEVIALAVECLRTIGLTDFQFNLGHMGIFSGLMEEAGLNAELRAQLEDFLARKDIVGIEVLVAHSGLSQRVQELLLRLPYLHGHADILDEVVELSGRASVRAAVDSLRRVYGYLEDFGVARHVALDLGILRGFAYYTGAIFEGYVPGVGFPVIEGGRYDLLYTDFHNSLPATGFALNLGSMLDRVSLKAEEIDEVLVYGSNAGQLIHRCAELRSQGRRVRMLLRALSPAEAEALAAGRVFVNIDLER